MENSTWTEHLGIECFGRSPPLSVLGRSFLDFHLLLPALAVCHDITDPSTYLYTSFTSSLNVNLPSSLHLSTTSPPHLDISLSHHENLHHRERGLPSGTRSRIRRQRLSFPHLDSLSRALVYQCLPPIPQSGSDWIWAFHAFATMAWYTSKGN